jgi:hypothetical protein
MAKAIFQGPVAAFSGRIGNLVYALQPDGTVVVRQFQEHSGKWSPAQLNQQSEVKAAAQYWRLVQRDPSKLAIYLGVPRKPGMGARHFAIRDYFNDPEITEIDVTGYWGGAGHPIRAVVKDDTAVAEVLVQILNMSDVVLEEGRAARDGTSDIWVYAGNNQLSSGQTVVVRITAKDHPGNSVTKTCLAYVR